MQRLRKIADGVLVGTSEAFTTISTIIIGVNDGCLVIDPAVSPADLALLADDLASAGLRPTAGFATHPHWDHVLWCGALGAVPRYASARGAATAAAERAGLIEGVERSSPGHDLDLVARLSALEPGTDVLPWDGPEARIITHDGHAPGHAAIFLPDTGTLLAGDMCSDVETPLPDLDAADPLGDYRAGLDLLAGLPVRIVVPGHGHVGDAAEFRRRVDADLAYLDRLESGAEPDDPRLSGWLVAEHDRLMQRLHGGPGADGAS